MRASEKAYEALRRDILAGAIAPGIVLTEVEAAEQLGVSRTPVREAFARLGSEGLLVLGTRGATVTDVEPADIVQIFDVRVALEVKQAQLAARHGDPAVFAALADAFDSAASALADGTQTPEEHYQLVRALDTALDAACNNPYVTSAMSSMRTLLARVRNRAGHHLARMLIATHEHANIARAIAQGDAELAATATHVHLANSLAHMLRVSGGASLGE